MGISYTLGSSIDVSTSCGGASPAYAPASATVLTSRPMSLPSRVAPSATSETSARPWLIATMFSVRYSNHLTGRPSFMATAAMTLCSG